MVVRRRGTCDQWSQTCRKIVRGYRVALIKLTLGFLEVLADGVAPKVLSSRISGGMSMAPLSFQGTKSVRAEGTLKDGLRHRCPPDT